MGEKSFYIKTLGCKVNQYESQVIRENFLKNGFLEADNIDDAEFCVINTCTVTSASDSKSLRLIRDALKRKNKYVIATGCMIEVEDFSSYALPGIKLIVKNKDKYRIPEVVIEEQRAESVPYHRLRRGTGQEEKKEKRKGYRVGITGFKGHTRVFVKIQDGCDNLCSYCKVRIVRGRSISRPFKEVLDECITLIRNGAKEIVLTGICLGAYGRDLLNGMSLPGLIQEICKIDGDWRLRLSSIEPKDVDENLIYQIQMQPKMCKHLHVPFQSGDDSVLKSMHRPYTKAEYVNIVNKLRSKVPDIGITTDIMVGFPGEAEERFYNTVDFIREVRPMRIHIFPYSRRDRTEAYKYDDGISYSVKRERKDILSRLAKDLAIEFVKGFLKKETRILVEDKRSSEGLLQGYTDRYIKAYIDGPDTLKGRFVTSCLALTNDKPYGILPSY